MASWRRSIGVALALGAALVAVAAGGCTEGPPDDAPGIVGTVTQLEGVAAGDGVVMLVEAAGAGSGGPADPSFVADRASVRVSSETEVFDRAGTRIDRSALAVGVKVRVWFEGPVAESYPVQGTAAAVQLDE